MRSLSVRLAALAATAALALSAAACGSSGSASTPAAADASGTGFPAAITTAIGVVHVKSRPGTIVSLSPTATEMLYAIGAGSQVKAVDDDSDYPPQAPMTKLSGFDPNLEAIVSYKPDLVVISNNVQGLAKHLAGFSIPVLDLPAPAGLPGVYSEFDQLGRATGHLTQAEHEVATLRRQISQVTASVPRHAEPVTYYYELDQTFYSLTSSTFVGNLLSLLGMKSIADGASGAAAAGGYPQLSAEYIVKASPDYIILADTVCCHQDAATVAARPGWSGLAAVKEGHVIPLDDDIASRWGPRIVDLLRAVATGITKGSG
ncbi:MAG TPA: ABC transporter substrate-binding protein [Streptosporangiaceae bacterium]|nr:ABC transporter substrate-binding protein [Streptosporangiaceae bacterium]